MADEAIQTRRFPGVAFRGPEHDRRAWVVGTGLDVWEIIQAHRQIGRDRLVGDTDLSAGHVDVALAYYEHHREQIDAIVSDNNRPLEHWQDAYPGLAITLGSG